MEVLFIWLIGSLYTRYDRAHITRPRVRNTAISCPSIRELKVTLILFPKVTTLSVKVSDYNGLESVEYSTDGGESWNLCKNGGAEVYTASLNLESYEDGLIPVDVRVKDIA